MDKVFVKLEYDYYNKKNEYINFAERIAQKLLNHEIDRFKSGIQEFKILYKRNNSKNLIVKNVFYRELEGLKYLREMLTEKEENIILKLDGYGYTVVNKLKAKDIDLKIIDELESFIFDKYVEHRTSNELYIVTKKKFIKRELDSKFIRRFIQSIDRYMYQSCTDKYKEAGSTLLLHKLEGGI